MAKSVYIEVRKNGQWERISVAEAIARDERNGRCVSCKKPVRAHKRGKNGAAAHAEHLVRSQQCDLSDHRVY